MHTHLNASTPSWDNGHSSHPGTGHGVNLCHFPKGKFMLCFKADKKRSESFSYIYWFSVSFSSKWFKAQVTNFEVAYSRQFHYIHLQVLCIYYLELFFFFLLKILFIYFKERQRAQARGRVRGRNRLPTEQGAWDRILFQDPEIITLAEGMGSTNWAIWAPWEISS